MTDEKQKQKLQSQQKNWIKIVFLVRCYISQLLSLFQNKQLKKNIALTIDLQQILTKRKRWTNHITTTNVKLKITIIRQIIFCVILVNKFHTIYIQLNIKEMITATTWNIRWRWTTTTITTTIIIMVTINNK